MGWKLAILNTVGTSILVNLENSIKGDCGKQNIKECAVGGRQLSQTLCDLLAKRPSRASPEDSVQKEFMKRATPGDPVFKEVLDVVRSDPTRFSAELNSLAGLMKSLSARSEIDEVEIYLYPTDTGTSKFCAEVIKRFLEEEGVKFLGVGSVKVYEPIVVKGFGAGPKFFTEGLVELIDKYARLIVSKSKQGYKVVVNATAGYKPESTYAVIMGLMAGAWRVVYMHEAFREVVELPMLPLTISQAYRDALKEVDVGAPRSVLEQKGVDVEDLLSRGLVEERDGYIRPKEWVSKLMEFPG